jgi:transcriptional regulator with XRE-family HTH domain
VNWKKLISDLMKSGMTQTEIGAAIGVSQGRIAQVINGKNGNRGFKYEPGAKLVELHRQRCLEPVDADLS